jgi:hypothetical protein
MIDPDLVGFAELERWINHQLKGDDQTEGLLRSILSAPDWDTIVRIKGIIFAYERVLETMQDIQRRMNEPHRRVG